MRHDVDLGVVPGDQLTVVPNFLCGFYCHARAPSLQISDFRVALAFPHRTSGTTKTSNPLRLRYYDRRHIITEIFSRTVIGIRDLHYQCSHVYAGESGHWVTTTPSRAKQNRA